MIRARGDRIRVITADIVNSDRMREKAARAIQNFIDETVEECREPLGIVRH